MAKNGTDDEPIVIKKYANRRLYNTALSSYITLDDLAKMTREGVDFKVIDAKSGDDITHSILTQIIMEEEAGGEQMLPVSFLRELIAMYGNQVQSMVPSYLEASMANFREQQSQLQEVFEQGMAGNAFANPFSQMAKQNMAMMREMAGAMMPGAATMMGGAAGGADSAEAEQSEPQSKAEGAADNTAKELDAMRAQMAAMQKKLDEMSG